MAIRAQASLPNRDMLETKAEQLIEYALPIGASPVTAVRGLMVVTGVAQNLWVNSDTPLETVTKGAEHISGLLRRYRSDALRTMDGERWMQRLLSGTSTEIRLAIGEIIDRTGKHMAEGFLSEGIRRPRINGLDCFVSAGAESPGSSLEVPLSMLRQAVRTFPVETSVHPDGSGSIPIYDYLRDAVVAQGR